MLETEIKLIDTEPQQVTKIKGKSINLEILSITLLSPNNLLYSLITIFIQSRLKIKVIL